MKYPLHVTSEIGELRTVMLHKPGKEIENLTPDYLERFLFDDIPYLPAIQREHDYFASTLRNRGIEVVYLETLAAEALHTNELRNQFIEDILHESRAQNDGATAYLREYLFSLSNEQLINQVMMGIRKSEVRAEHRLHLYEMMEDQYPFYLDPLPNLYFTRDPAAVICDGISINRMNREARRRESLFMHYIIHHHPRFASYDIPIWFNRDFDFSLEGGDQLILSSEVIAIGVSERTSARAIESLALNLFNRQTAIKKVLAIELPKIRSFMHLDTVFTMIDRNKFTIHQAIQDSDGNINIYILEPDEEDRVKITHKTNLFNTLKEALNLEDLDLIPCGGGDIIASAREQWNDGSNTLSIAPGVVVTYDRNYVSNETLRSHGVEVIEVLSSELARGRGGPRCMSMPLYREDL